jgi:hypothetical protein
MALEPSLIEELAATVSLAKIKEQRFKAPLPKRVIVEPSSDDPDGQSLDVTLVFATDTDLAQFGRPGVSDMYFWIAKTLRETLKGRAVPYISAVSESSLRPQRH